MRRRERRQNRRTREWLERIGDGKRPERRPKIVHQAVSPHPADKPGFCLYLGITYSFSTARPHGCSMANPARAKILVVDDTEVNISILAEFLGPEYDIDTAAGGLQALQRVAAAPPDLILLDVMMPGMDGFEVCRRLKSDDQTADIPIIFITALDDVATETRGLALGAIDFITKPFNPAVVRARVANHLALREAARLKEDVERIMRHDLKSPLTTVISLPQLLLMDENLSQIQRGMLRRIEDAGYTLMAMVNLSTTLFRMERGSYELRPEDMDLAAVTGKVLAGFAETAAMRRSGWPCCPVSRARSSPSGAKNCSATPCSATSWATPWTPPPQGRRSWSNFRPRTTAACASIS
jgi:CheY-like chemotaxis protein